QQIHLTASGNAYAFIKRGQKNKRPQEIIPLMPNAVEPERKNGELVYTVTLDDGSTQQVEAWRMIHVPGMGFDGVKGYSPIKMASENIGLALAAQEFGGRFFGQGANVNSVIEMPGNLKSPEEIARFKKSFSESYQGLSNAHGTPLLEDGAKLVRVGVPPEEAQFLETRKFQVEDIARIYGVPLHMLSSTEKSTSWGTGLEQQNLGFLVHTLRPWLVAWEQELNRKLLLPSEREKYNIEFKLDALLRGDTKSRYEGYSIGRQWGWLSVNDIRELENMDRIDGGDAYLVPLNMQPHDEPAEDNEQVRSLQAAIVSQIVKREYNGLKSKVGSDDLAEWWAGFSASTREGLKTLGLSEKRATQFINSGLDVQDIEGWQERRTAQLIELLRAEP
ncbi:MAG: phage portal protein, partial [Gammaproteobacteria bacterium]|nr:phage portal protein [Gammaproteobacteria bacterium]